MNIAEKTIMVIYVNVPSTSVNAIGLSFMDDKLIEKEIKKSKKRLRLEEYEDLVYFFVPTDQPSRIELLK